MSARMFVAASTNQTKGVANILWLAGIQGDSDMLHQYVCTCVLPRIIIQLKYIVTCLVLPRITIQLKIHKNNLKIMNLKREVGIDHCHKKQGNKV